MGSLTLKTSIWIEIQSWLVQVSYRGSVEALAAAAELHAGIMNNIVRGTVSSKITLVILFQIFQDKQKKNITCIERCD